MKKILSAPRAAATCAGLLILCLLTLSIAFITQSAFKSQGFEAHAASVRQSGRPVICAVGDTGSGNRNQYRVGEAMAAHGCTNILFLGDNFYPSGVSSIHDPQWVTAFENPYAALIAAGATFHVALGNHDYKGDVEAQLLYSIARPYFSLPTRYHFTQIDNMCLIAIDTNQITESQMGWLVDQLHRTTCAIKIVYGHHPIVSSGRHGAGDEILQKSLRPLLGSADLYIAGHDHHYSDEGNVPTGTGEYFRQLVVGTGGARIRPTLCRTEDCRDIVNDYGFLVLHPAPTPAGMSWSFYDKDLELVSNGELGR